MRRRCRGGGQTALPKDSQRCVLEGSPKVCQILMDTEGGKLVGSACWGGGGMGDREWEGERLGP